MAGVVLAAARHFDLAPDVVFASIAGQERGWLFGARCDRIEVGATISLEVPFAADSGAFWIHGRIRRLRPDALLEIEHAQPWRGRTTVRLSASRTAGTRVALTCELDEGGAEWLVRRAGLPSFSPSRPGVRRVGLLTSKTGSAAIFALATENVGILAVEDINADGPDRPYELVVGDDATSTVTAEREVDRLADAGCRVIVACVTSASFAAAQRAARRRGVLIIHSLLNEGGRPLASAVRLGERPQRQLRAAVGPLMRHSGGSRWFIVGHTYSWSLAAGRAAREVIPAAGGTIAGEARLPLGHGDYRPVVERIMRSGADLVLSSLVGEDEVRFERASHAAGLRARATTLSLVMEESTLEHIGRRQAAGVWAAMAYFEALPTEVNRDFVRRYRARFGTWAPPVSSLSESVYSAFMLLERALASEPEGSPLQLSRSLRRVRRETPRGMLSFDEGETYTQDIHLAVAGMSGFRLQEIPRARTN